jgi:hypothetical protein
VKYRKLRIAWSVACGIICLLLIALWVRSYTVEDRLSRLKVSGVDWFTTALVSNWGKVNVIHFRARNARVDPTKIHDWKLIRSKSESQIEAYFFKLTTKSTLIRAPHYFVIIIVSTMGAIPWVRWRFSLRTLLIVMTLIAVALGAVIYAAR